MITGIFAGIAWALETVILGLALGMSNFISTEEAIFLAPFVATFLHDAFSAIYMFLYNAIRGNLRSLLSIRKSTSFKWLVMASVIGGPVGMTGYVLAVKYMGASVGAVASAIYPAVGTALACIFLKEKVKWYQWVFLCFTLLGVFGLSYSPSLNVDNFWLGLLGAVMCALGWGMEAVILAKCLKDPSIKDEYALNVRQTVSALVYGVVLLPILGGWTLTAEVFTAGSMILPTVACAALFASVSYLFYYRTIAKIGASKAMALNITYTAWAIFFSALLLFDFSALNPLTLGCAGVIVVCGILAATDIKKLITK